MRHELYLQLNYMHLKCTQCLRRGPCSIQGHIQYRRGLVGSHALQPIGEDYSIGSHTVQPIGEDQIQDHIFYRKGPVKDLDWRKYNTCVTTKDYIIICINHRVTQIITSFYKLFISLTMLQHALIYTQAIGCVFFYFGQV